MKKKTTGDDCAVAFMFVMALAQAGGRGCADRDESSRSAAIPLVSAQDNGVTQDELIEAITHLAFYKG